MRNLLLSLLLITISQYVSGQDTVIKKNSQQLNVQVVEQTNKILKYKMEDYKEGPILWMKLNKISSIEYKNGHIDRLGNQNPRKYRPLGLSAGAALAPVGRSGFISSTINYSILPQIDLEVSLGTSDITSYGFYFSGGTRFHINSKYSEKRLTPFTGILAGSNYGDGFVQIPLGVNWLDDSGLNASLSLNEMIGFDSWFVTFMEIRIGWRFKL